LSFYSPLITLPTGENRFWSEKQKIFLKIKKAKNKAGFCRLTPLEHFKGIDYLHVQSV